MTTFSGERMLILAPHCDDAEFGVGGWMTRMREENIGEARFMIFAYGNYIRSDGQLVQFETRQQEALDAAALLGVEARFMAAFIENQADRMYYADLVAHVEQAITGYEPTEVFVCLPSFNQDHRVLYDATITAMRPGMFPEVKNLWAYEYPGTCWGPPPPNMGRCYLKLTPDQLEKKITALLMHKSQFEGRDVAVGPEAARVLARCRGADIGVKYAECVYLIREIF